MTDNFRYGDKKEISYEKFVQKLDKAQNSSNADLWKLFGIFDKDKNGKIETTNSQGVPEAKSLFNYIQKHSGENFILEEKELDKLIEESNIAEADEEKISIKSALKQFLDLFSEEDEITVENLNNTKITKQNGRIIQTEENGAIKKYTYHEKTEESDEYAEITTGNETTKVSKIEEDGTYLAENFISKKYIDENNNTVTVIRDNYGRIVQTIDKTSGDSVTTIYNTTSVYAYDNFKNEPALQTAQILIRNGEELYVSYDENGNTITHIANNDSPNKIMTKDLGFENVEQLYKLNPKLRNLKNFIVGNPLIIPGHRDVTDEAIVKQGSISGENIKYVKAYNTKQQREYQQNLEEFRSENIPDMDKEVFAELNKTKGFEFGEKTVQMYYKISQFPTEVQKFITAEISTRVAKGQSPDVIKKHFLQNPVVSLDGEHFIKINLYDGPTIELPHFENTSTMKIGNFMKSCNTELLFFEQSTEDNTQCYSVETFFKEVLKLDITQGEGKTLYEQFINVNDPYVMTDINEMFTNISRRTGSAYKTQYNKAKSELTESYKETYMGKGIAEALDNNKPLSKEEALDMYKAVIKSMTTPQGQHVTTKYDDFINDHKDFYLRKFATEMVAYLYNRNADISQQTSANKSILNPVGKYTLGSMASRYSKDAQTIYALMSSDCYLGNKKINQTIKAYDTQYPGYNRAKVKKCMEVMQNPDATDEQKMKALGEAFGHRLAHSADNLSSVCNFADGVTDIILLMTGTGVIGRGLTKAVSLIPRAGKTLTTAESVITGAKGVSWTQRATSVGISSATFSIYDSARYVVDYYSSDMYTSQGVSFGSGLTSTAMHSAAFGAFASVWGQAVTGNALKWIFKSPQADALSQDALRMVTNQFKNTKKLTSSQLLSAYNGAMAKASGSTAKSIASFTSELAGFSAFEIGDKWLNGELKDSSLGDILKGQFKTLLSFKAVGQILYMRKAGKLPADAIKIDKSQEIAIEPAGKDGKNEFKLTYPDGKVETVPDMRTAIAICNRHYEKVAIYDPIEKALEQEKTLNLDEGISIKKDEKGYTIELGNGEKISSENLRTAMLNAQTRYQLLQYDNELAQNGSCKLASGQEVIFDKENNVYTITLDSGTKVENEKLEELLKNASEAELCENLEKDLNNSGQILLDDNSILSKNDDGKYELKTVLNNGKLITIQGNSVKDVTRKAMGVKILSAFAEQTKPDDIENESENNTNINRTNLGVDASGKLTSTRSNGFNNVDVSRFELTENGFRELLSELKAKHSGKARIIDPYDFYNEEYIKLFNKNPEFVMNLMKEQLSVQGIGKSYELSPDQIETLMQLQTEHPEAYSKMPLRNSLTGELRIDYDHLENVKCSAECFIRAYEKNPELTMELVNTRVKSGDDMILRFNFRELKEAIDNIDTNPKLKDAIFSKVINTQGEEQFAFSYYTIKCGLLDDFAYPKEKKLLDIKTKDGKYSLFSEEDIKLLLRRDIDDYLEDLKNPEKADNARKNLLIILADSKYYDIVKNRIEDIFDDTTKEFILEQIPDDVYSADIGELYVDGNFIVRTIGAESGIKTTKFIPTPVSIDIISNEEVIFDNGKTKSVKTEYTDGRYIIDTFELSESEKDGKTQKIVQGQKRTVYDANGEIVYEESVTPSKISDVEFDITTSDKDHGRVTAGETRIFGKNTPLTQTIRSVESPNGLKTETIVLQEEGCRKTFYTIKDANNKIILSQARAQFEISDDKCTSIVSHTVDNITSSDKYDIEFKDNEISVTKEGKDGKPDETVTFDSSTFDPEFKNLIKQLPGDFLFAIKKAGIKGIKISKTDSQAFYNPETNTIVISADLKNNPFVLAHELGHAIDEVLLNNLSNDSNLKEIFEKELEKYKDVTSDAEGRIIDYFTTKLHYTGNCLIEVIAEVNAIVSGLRNDWSILAMRGLKLLQNFPETIKYISDKLTSVYTGNVEIDSSTKENSSAEKSTTIPKPGIAKDNYSNESMSTIIAELEADIVSIKTQEDYIQINNKLEQKRSALTENTYQKLKSDLDLRIGEREHTIDQSRIEEGSQIAKPWEVVSEEREIERQQRIKALDDMNIIILGKLAERLESIIETSDLNNQEDLARIKELINDTKVDEFERTYLNTLLETRLNPPTIENVTHQQIAAEVKRLIRHFEKEKKNINEQTQESGITKMKGFTNPRIKSDTSTYDKLYNFMKDNEKKGATLIDAIGDVRDIYGMRSILEADDYTSIPEVDSILTAAESALTPEDKRALKIEAGREAGEFQSEILLEMIKAQMIEQAKSPDGLKGVRMVNYVSENGIPVLSESQLWDLKNFAMDLGVKEEHIVLIDPQKEVFSKEGIGSKEYTSRTQNGYTAFQMNFETKNGDWIEFQCRDEITNRFAEIEHFIYDILTGKDIIGRNPDLKPLFDLLLEALHTSNLPENVCKLYRKTYITDYYTYCRAKSLGIDLGEPRLEDYEKRIGKELGIPDLKLDVRLDVSNLFVLHDIADLVKSKQIEKEEGIELYKKKLSLAKFERGEATPEEFEKAKTDFLQELDEYGIIGFEKDISQKDFAIKVYAYNLIKAEYKDKDKDKSVMAHNVHDMINSENFNTFKEMYFFLKKLKLHDYETNDLVFYAARVLPESLEAAKEFFITIKNDIELQKKSALLFDFETLPPEKIKQKTEIYKVFANTQISRGNLKELLMHSDITYEPIMEIVNKISNSEYYQSLIKNGKFDLTYLPFGLIDAKIIAENFDAITHLSQKYDTNYHALATYELFNDTPPDKREALIELFDSIPHEELKNLADKWCFEENYYTSTPQDQCENELGVLKFKKNLIPHGFTEEELKNFSIETLFILDRLVSGVDVVFSPEERKILINNNLDRRLPVLQVVPAYLEKQLICCDDEYFDNMTQQIKNRSLILDYCDLKEEDVEKILNMSQEKYDKLCELNEQFKKINTNTHKIKQHQLSFILSLSDEVFYNIINRLDVFRNRELSTETIKDLLEMSDEEYAEFSIPLSERKVGEDIDAEEYRAEVRAMLDGSYTLDMSAYNQSRAKIAAEKAANDKRKVIAFDESKAITPKSSEKTLKRLHLQRY